MQKRLNIVRDQKNYWKLSATSLVMITKQQIRNDYINKITLKTDEKKIKYYQISKKLL